MASEKVSLAFCNASLPWASARGIKINATLSSPGFSPLKISRYGVGKSFSCLLQCFFAMGFSPWDQNKCNSFLTGLQPAAHYAAIASEKVSLALCNASLPWASARGIKINATLFTGLQPVYEN